jgi:hypothetical protein
MNSTHCPCARLEWPQADSALRVILAIVLSAGLATLLS